MTAGLIIFLCATSIALLVVPRRWAPLPFIMTACHLSITQSIEIGPFNFTAIRILIAVGVVRVIVRGERLVGGLNVLDWWMLAWGGWAVASGLFHENGYDTFINRLGLLYNTLGFYALLRIFCTSIEDVIGLTKATAILLVPVALEMIYEMWGNSSLFYLFEGYARPLYIRHGRVRAVGPFVHPILAGTVGGVCLPLMVGMWKRQRLAASAGIFACLGMVVASASSGPIMSTIAALAGLAMWSQRHRMRTVRWILVAAYFALALAMKAPVYYLIARINFVDGSTGYHRALLIESAIKYLDTWWLAGTDYTRNWAPSPGHTPYHTDITNHFLAIAILGGLPLLLLFIGTLAKAYGLVGTRLKQEIAANGPNQFMLWGLGAALFSHTITFLSVSYFDQSLVFLYVALAAIGSARASATAPVPSAAPVESAEPREHAWVAAWRRNSRAGAPADTAPSRRLSREPSSLAR
jgi:hypothetical protein